jgi:O-antigen ligase
MTEASKKVRTDAAARPTDGATGGARSDRLIGLVFLVAVLPLFVDAAQRTMPVFQLATGFGAPDTAGSRLHLVLPLVAVLALVALLRKRPSLRRPLPIVVMLLVLDFTLSIAWGLYNGAGLVGFVFFVQTIVPLVAWLAAYRVSPTPRTVARAVMVGVLVVAVVALGYTILNGGIGDAYYSSIALEDPFPQYRAYYPALVALAIALAVAHIRTDRVLSSVTIAACLLLLPIMWSRAGILMVVLAFVASLFWCHYRRLTWRGRFAVVAATAVVLGAVGAVTVTVGLTEQRTRLNDLQASDSDRITLAQESSERIAGNPLVGDAFQAHGSDLVGGAVANFDRLFPSHNQYLDFGIRGGAPALLLLVVFLALTAWLLFWRWVKDAPEDFDPFYGAVLAFLMALVPAGLTELYISQTWTGVAIMLVLGAAAHRLELDRLAARSEDTGAVRLVDPADPDPADRKN